MFRKLLLIAIVCLLSGCTPVPETGLVAPLRSFHQRQSIQELQQHIVGGFGDYRLRGHKHAGLDISAKPGETVYAMGAGKVVAIWGKFPNTSVIIRQQRKNKQPVYIGYTHLVDLKVGIGKSVTRETPLGRVLSTEEQQRTHFQYTHVHIEIRKTIADGGKASYSCFTLADLLKNFYEPYSFLKQELE